MGERARSGRLAAGTAAVAALILASMVPPDAGAAPGAASASARDPRGPATHEKQDYDARHPGGPGRVADESRRSALASSRGATQALQQGLGDQAVVEMDGTTGTPRIVARLDGFLTPASDRAATRIALDYVSSHLDALGLRASDLATFRLQRDYRDVVGTHHLTWTQQIGGAEVFGNGLQASVTRRGQLLSLGGAPVSALETPTSTARRITSAGQAIAAARADLDEPTGAGARDTARSVVFVSPAGPQRTWQVTTMSARHPAVTVVDAGTGSVLFRKSLGKDATTPADPDATQTSSTALAFDYFPEAPTGGTAEPVDLTRRGWLRRNAAVLSGNNTHTYSDVDDDNQADPGEEVPPSGAHRWNYRLKAFDLPGVSFCGNPYPCSWDPDKPFSWRVNRKQNGTQAFFFVNNWHDHLAQFPIGFTEAAGNFQRVNETDQGLGGDPVDTETDDGANTDHGLPDGSHVDNANMNTPPDGQSPRMQLYLQHTPGTTYPGGDPFAPTNVGDEADTVYHEYTHGLSNRLVVDASGVSALGGVQAGAMGEAWSDWYAMDYLVDRRLQPDRPNRPDVVLFQYDGRGVALDRTQPIDCKVGQTAKRCDGGLTGHSGGYTYADYGTIAGGPEVHADGEVWAETLWDLRDRLGPVTTEMLVTRAMELSPANPSFLDERNAILLADNAAYDGRNADAIWSVFAGRGMGYFAGSFGGDDTQPGADFHTPPTDGRRAKITGRVTDADTGRPVAGVSVSLAFQGAPGTTNPSDVTSSTGRYVIGPVPVGTYSKLRAIGNGYEPATSSVTVRPGGSVRDFVVRRDWAASSGGGSVSSFTGPDYSSFGCGPTRAIDLSQGTGWGSTAGNDDGDPTNVFVPKHIDIALPQAVDVSGFAVDPSATCGDGGSASTGDYRIETSSDGNDWVEASSGTFAVADRGVLNPIPAQAGSGDAVRFVRFTILGNQTPEFATSCPGAFSGCSYADLSEIEVYGAPAG